MFHNYEEDEYDDRDSEPLGMVHIISRTVIWTWFVVAVIAFITQVAPWLSHEFAFLRAVIPGAWNSP